MSEDEPSKYIVGEILFNKDQVDKINLTNSFLTYVGKFMSAKYETQAEADADLSTYSLSGKIPTKVDEQGLRQTIKEALPANLINALTSKYWLNIIKQLFKNSKILVAARTRFHPTDAQMKKAIKKRLNVAHNNMKKVRSSVIV